MIPIFADPKRFAASLSPSGMISRMKMKCRYRYHIRGFSSLPMLYCSVVKNVVPRIQWVPSYNLSTLSSNATMHAVTMDKKVSIDDNWWTGKAPVHGSCPGVNEKGIIHSIPQVNLKNCSPQVTLLYMLFIVS